MHKAQSRNKKIEIWWNNEYLVDQILGLVSGSVLPLHAPGVNFKMCNSFVSIHSVMITVMSC